jgi:hypothetical protein
MDKETGKTLSILIGEAADTIELLLQTTDAERSKIAAEAMSVVAQLRAVDDQLLGEILAAALAAKRR